MRITESDIREALASPVTHADTLAAIFNDRGDRDAALVVAARSGDWEGLRLAATLALAFAAGSQASVFGPLTVLAAAIWADPAAEADPAPMLLIVPESDGAHRMASLLLRLIAAQDDTLTRTWVRALVGLDTGVCLAFKPQPQPVG